MSDLTLVAPVLLAMGFGLLGRHLDAGRVVLPRWVDGLLLLSLVVSGVAAAGGWYAPFHLDGGDWVYHDFPDYCSVVDALARGEAAPPSSRSLLLGGVVAGLARRWGLFDGMVLGGWLGLGLTLLGMLLWARLVAGRLAAVVTGVVALAVGPLVLLARTPTFYPLMDGVFALAAAAAAWALRSGRCAPVLVAGLAAGACGLVDGRGLSWTLALAAAAGVGALLGPVAPADRPSVSAGSPVPGAPSDRGRRRLLATSGRLAAVGLGVGCVWGVGRVVQTEAQCAYLEPQVLAFVQTVTEHNGRSDVRPAGFPSSCPPGAGYCWGWSTPAELRASASCLRDLTDQIPNNLEVTGPALAYTRAVHLDPWLPVVLTAGLLAALTSAGRPRALLALLLPALPFLAGWDFVGRTEVDPRRLAPVLLAVPVWVGVATAGLVGRGRTGGDPRVGVGVGLGVVLGWLLLVSGTVPSAWGPAAAWRARWEANAEHLGLRQGHMVDAGSGRPACAAGLAAGPADLGWAGVVRRVEGR